MSKHRTFMERCLAGEVDLDFADDAFEEWHEGDRRLPVHEHLGMSEQEYFLWVERPEAISLIVRAHRFDLPIADVVSVDETSLPLAARGTGEAQSEELVKWLRETGWL